MFFLRQSLPRPAWSSLATRGVLLEPIWEKDEKRLSLLVVVIHWYTQLMSSFPAFSRQFSFPYWCSQRSLQRACHQSLTWIVVISVLLKSIATSTISYSRFHDIYNVLKKKAFRVVYWWIIWHVAFCMQKETGTERIEKVPSSKQSVRRGNVINLCGEVCACLFYMYV